MGVIMDEKEELISEARNLEAPSENAAEEFSKMKDELAVKLKERMTEREDIEELIGKGNRPMMEDNSINMVKFFDSIFTNYEPKVFVETVHWVFRTYRSHGFKPDFWPANLNSFVNIMQEELSEETFDELNPFLHWIIDNIPVFIELTEEYQEVSG